MDKQEKAIEEAKSRVKNYMENGWTDHELSIYIKGFVEGSVWSIESAYHQPGDIPTDDEIILCETKVYPMIAGPNHENFNETVEHFGITRWAYTKDLLPGVAPSPERKLIIPKYQKGDVVMLKPYDKCIELNKNLYMSNELIKEFVGRQLIIMDIEFDLGQPFYKLDGGASHLPYFPECFLEFIGNELQVPKMNAVTSKYIKGQFVVIRSEIELRSMFGKDADLTNYIPYAGEVVMIDEIVNEGSGFLYKIRKYHHKEAIYVSEDVILCDANDRPQRGPLECRNEIDSIIARDIHVAQLDTSKLNPSPMQIWNDMFSGTKGFLSSASPELRAFAAGQLLGLSEMIMKEMTDGTQKGK